MLVVDNDFVVGAVLDQDADYDEDVTGAPSDQVRSQYQDVADFDWWDKVWEATLAKPGVSPTYQPALTDTLALPDGEEVTMAPFPDRGSSGRMAAHPQAVRVVSARRTTAEGAPNALPTTPQDVRPPDGRISPNSAQLAILTGMVVQAFRVQKLKEPFVTGVVASTKPAARQHAWAISLQLEAQTFPEVQKKLPGIRQALGCPWLRVGSSRDGVTLFAGAVPSRRDAANERAWLKSQELDWAHRWVEARIVGDDGGTPAVVEAEVLEGNEKVTRTRFELPSTLSVDRVKGNLGRLRSSTRLAFVEIMPQSSPRDLVLMTSPTDPMPFPARFDEDEAMNPRRPLGMAFSVGFDGLPREYVPERDVSLMVLGMSGSGKSVTLQAVIASAIAQGSLVAETSCESLTSLSCTPMRVMRWAWYWFMVSQPESAVVTFRASRTAETAWATCTWFWGKPRLCAPQTPSSVRVTLTQPETVPFLVVASTGMSKDRPRWVVAKSRMEEAEGMRRLMPAPL